jgi:hypothetical protein
VENITPRYECWTCDDLHQWYVGGVHGCMQTAKKSSWFELPDSSRASMCALDSPDVEYRLVLGIEECGHTHSPSPREQPDP